MCSIFGLLDLPSDLTTDQRTALRREVLAHSRRQRHRGPDWSGVHADEGAILAHERLAIVDPVSGAQPLYSNQHSGNRQQVLAVNGEIYNHQALKAEHAPNYPFQTASDCEIILALYPTHTPAELCTALNGIYAFVLWDPEANRYLIGRDPIGVMPLYWGRDAQRRRVIASELKALHDLCDEFSIFPPGRIVDVARRKNRELVAEVV
ncbi:MAG: asparagine synthase B, partial [Pseudomonadota bacterium]